MTLSPEERQRIYEEEKARHEAQQELRTEGKGKARRGCAIGCLGVGGVLVVLWLIGSLLPSTRTGEHRDSAKFDMDQLLQDVNQSREISGLVEARVVHRVQIFDWGVAVVIAPRFYLLSYEEKIAVARTVAAVVGQHRGGDHFLFYDWQTNRKVGSWSSEYGLRLEKSP